MEQVANSVIGQWGAIGILLVVLILILYFMFKFLKDQTLIHRQERQEWLAVYQEQSDKSTAALINNTAALTELKTRLS